MKKKIEKWLQDERFTDYADRRILTEVDDVCENHRPDPEYEELVRAFRRDVRYIVPMVAYLSYRLQVAKLQRMRESANVPSGGYSCSRYC